MDTDLIKTVEDAGAHLYVWSLKDIPQDLRDALAAARDRETHPVGRKILETIATNVAVADDQKNLVCQGHRQTRLFCSSATATLVVIVSRMLRPTVCVLAVARGGQGVAQVLGDVLQRPDVEVGASVLDGLGQIALSGHAQSGSFQRAASAAARPRAGRTRRSRAGSCPSSCCGRALRR